MKMLPGLTTESQRATIKYFVIAALLFLVQVLVGGATAHSRAEKYIKISFFGLNIGLALMVLGNLFPGGVLQFRDVLKHRYWHARGLEYLNQGFVRFIEWCRLPGDLVFIVLGVVPLVIAMGLTYLKANPWSRSKKQPDLAILRP